MRLVHQWIAGIIYVAILCQTVLSLSSAPMRVALQVAPLQLIHWQSAHWPKYTEAALLIVLCLS